MEFKSVLVTLSPVTFEDFICDLYGNSQRVSDKYTLFKFPQFKKKNGQQFYLYRYALLHFSLLYKICGKKIILRDIHKIRYRKNSKYWDTLNYHRDCPTNEIVGIYSAILRSKDADRITNRVESDQTAP